MLRAVSRLRLGDCYLVALNRLGEDALYYFPLAFIAAKSVALFVSSSQRNIVNTGLSRLIGYSYIGL